MSKLVINTQYRENYSFDNDGYPVEGPEAHWKYKGGSAYVVEGLTSGMINKIGQNGIPELTKLLEYKNAASEEYIIDWEIVEDNAKVCESWETVTQIFINEDNVTALKVTDNREDGYMRSEILELTEAWTMLPESERSEYSASYLMKDGDICNSQDELKEWFEVAA